MNKSLAFLVLIFVSNVSLSQEPRYRFILPPRPSQPPALNNTVQPQIANQNINFNTGNSASGFGIGGGFSTNSGGIQGTIQYTQNNTPGTRISLLYQLPSTTQFQQGVGLYGQVGGNMFGQNVNQFGNNGFGQNGFGNNGFNQNNNRMSGQPIGVDNPFYQMAMQGITAGVSGSAFQSGGYNMGGQMYRNGAFGQFGGNQFGNNQFGNNQFGNNQFGFNQFNNNQFGFGQFGGGFNNGGNGL